MRSTCSPAALVAALLTVCAASPLPAPVPSAPASVAALLGALSGACHEDALLREALRAGRLQGCDAVPGERAGSRAALRCMSFLDINRRLCALVRHAPARNLTRELRAQQSAPVPAVAALCARPDKLSYADLAEYPGYHANMERVLVLPNRCLAFCASEDIESDEPDYFCKVLYWGNNILSNVDGFDALTSNNTSIATIEASVSEDKVLKKTEMQMSDDESLSVGSVMQSVAGAPPPSVTNIPAQSSMLITDAKPLISGNSVLEGQARSASPVLVDLKPSDEIIPPLKNQSSDGSKTPDNNLQLTVTPEKGSNAGIQLSGDQTAVESKKEGGPHNTVVKPSTKIGDPAINEVKDPGNNFDETARDVPAIQLNPETIKKVHGNIPNQANRPDPDGLDDEYDNQDQGEDPEKSLLDENAIEDQAMVAAKPEQSARPPVRNPFPNDRNFNPNVGDDFLEEEDGHFFPMFLSVVAMFALLYILYHNKNKIMGLLIEGRQNGGRRRNSRGHAYRRLDTLEQAISSNATGAPPSKIIY